MSFLLFCLFIGFVITILTANNEEKQAQKRHEELMAASKPYRESDYMFGMED